MKYMTYNYFNEIHVAQSMRPSLNDVALPGTVGMGECSLDLIFFKIRDDPFGFLVVVGRGMFFQQQLKLEYYFETK